MDTAEIRKWCARYDRDMPKDVEKERHLADEIKTRGFATKDMLLDVMDWKFEGMRHVLPTQRRHVKKTVGERIEQVTKEALGSGLPDSQRMDLLEQLPGVGPKVASVILTFWNPADFGVFDFHAWNGLAAEKLVDRAHEASSEEYVSEFLPVLRKLAGEHRLTARQVEKAYYYKDYCRE